MAGKKTEVSTIMAMVSVPPLNVCYRVDWQADDTDGSVDTALLPLFDGDIILVVTKPGTVVAPSNGYNITLFDGCDYDLMHGALEGRSATAIEHDRCPTDGGLETMDRPVAGQVEVHITDNTANSATGTIFIYVRQHQ